MDEATRISLKDQFNSLLVRAIEGRRGGMALMRVLEELDFYNSPASAKHHLNVPGGLVLHSLNVARAALELCDKMPQFAKCNKDAVLTAALLHDVCKAGHLDFVIYFSCGGWSSGGALRLKMICGSFGSRPSSLAFWAISSIRPTGKPFSSSGPS